MEDIKSQTDKIKIFLRESNKIELVYDDESLDDAIEAWEYLNKQKKLTIRNILDTHDILMYRHLYPPDRGMFRRVDVWIGGHKAVAPVMVPSLMQLWVKQANKDNTETEIKRSHVALETVHPFLDGNGRLGRLIMNWQRVKNGLPILVIKEKEKNRYYFWFR